MKNRHDMLEGLLRSVKDGGLSVEDGLERLRDLPYLELEHAKIDLHRDLRNGFPEVIYAEGKTAEQVAAIVLKMRDHGPVLATRVSPEKAEHVIGVCPEAEYNSLGRTLTVGADSIEKKGGAITVVTAGTSDLPVAEEARVTGEMFGNHCSVVEDIGVAGLHRMFDQLPMLRTADVIIVIAGMEGALASVIGGVVAQPIIAVPTSVGYGAAFSGVAPLLGMLTSCASGISVVNIDNGFGAACAANRIIGSIERRSTISPSEK